MSKEAINIVWLKRDLRLSDHEPLALANANGLYTILLYIFEPSLMQYADSSHRHQQFVWQSLMDMNKKLKNFSGKENNIFIANNEAIDVFYFLENEFDIKHVFSHQEIGNNLSYTRDKQLDEWFKQNNITWTECKRDGIIRGQKYRPTDWNKKWMETMNALQFGFDLNLFIPNDRILKEIGYFNIDNSIKNYNKIFQPGGENYAFQYLQSFIENRHINYAKHISKPVLARKSCSRLSPYLAWGNISMRQVYQAVTSALKQQNTNKRALQFYIARLHWHCHFIQKFETDCSMEFNNVNSAYNCVRLERNEKFIEAWKTGNTGFPLIDACMRSVIATGYLNFRMRAMLVSFLTHNLWQDWRTGAHHLAQQFLDFEPGIHYPQFQMQAATMGVHTIRTYNPIKQSYDHDENGEFIKQWIPELATVPSEFIHEPWLMNLSQQQDFNCLIGKDYPAPIVDLKISTKIASDNLWALKKSYASKSEINEILNKLSHRNTEDEVKLGAGVVDRESTFKRKKKTIKKVAKAVVEQVKMDL